MKPLPQPDPKQEEDVLPQRWAWLLLLLILPLGCLCVFWSTSLSLNAQPDRLAEVSLLASRQVDYGSGDGEAKPFARVDPGVIEEATADAARLAVTPPVEVEDEEAPPLIAALPPTPITGSGSSESDDAPEATATPLPTAAPLFDPIHTPTSASTATPLATATPLPLPATFTGTPLPTHTASSTPIPPSPTGTNTPSPIPPTNTPIPLPTNTPVPTSTNIPAPAPKDTNTPVPPAPTATSTETATPLPPTLIPTETPTPAPTFTDTPIPMITPTETPTPAPTFTETPTPTATPTETPTNVPLRAPVVQAIVPNTGVNTGPVPITISGFGFLPGCSASLQSPLFGTTPLPGGCAPNTTVNAVVPAGLTAGYYTVTVTNPDGQSGSVANAYTVTNPIPVVLGVNPALHPIGADFPVTITGTNFVNTGAPGTLMASLNGIPLTNLSYANSTTLNAVVPANSAGMGSGSYNLTVTNPGPTAPSGSLMNAVTLYTYTNQVSCAGGVIGCSDTTGEPDNAVASILNNTGVITFDFGLGNGITDGPGYDLVFYGYWLNGGIYADLITITISADGSTWYPIFAWDMTPGGVNGTNIDSYAADGEGDDEFIPSSALFPRPPRGWGSEQMV